MPSVHISKDISKVRLGPAATAADASPTALVLEEYPVFARFLASVMEQLMELDSGRLSDMVAIHQRGGNWEAASRYYDFG